MRQDKIMLVVFSVGLGLASGCGKSDANRYTANESSAPSTTQTASTPAPSAVVVERTTVLAVDTNKPASSGSQMASNTSTNNAPALNSSAGGPANNASGTESSFSSTNHSGSFSTNSTSSGGAAENQQGHNFSTQASKSEQYIGYQVLDADGQSIGTVEALWDDQKGSPAFLAVDRPNEDKLYVIPTSEVQESQNRKALRLPYTSQTLQQAPTFSKESDLDAAAQQKVAGFFNNHEPVKLSSTTSTKTGSGKETQAAADNSKTATQSEIADAERLNKATIRLKEEQVKIGKRQVDAGGVLLRKVVRTETVNKPVELKHEEFTIQRVPGSGKPIQGNTDFAEREVFIPLIREEPVIQRDVVLKETVNVGKTAKEEQETVNAKRREEDLQIVHRSQAGEESSGAPAASSSGKSKQEQTGKSTDQGNSSNQKSADNK